MKYKHPKAFTLTELLIVLVVIALLFAALAPIIAKKIASSDRAEEMIWSYVKNDDYKDAYFDSGVPSKTGVAYIGLNPKVFKTISQEPYSKVVIKANKINGNPQNHIQFRYGRENDGYLSGLVSLDDNSNILMTTKLAGTRNNNFKTFQNTGAKRNTAAGAGAFAQMTKSTNENTSIGASSTQSATTYDGVVAVGANSNQNSTGQNSTFIGANTGRGELTPKTVAVGASSLGLPTSSASSSVLLGYYVGATGFEALSAAGTSSAPRPVGNVIVGSQYYGKYPNYNTILGNNTYVGGSPNATYLTAIGKDSCASVQDSSSSVNSINTCIGYTSAKNYGVNDATYSLNWNTDGYEHIYLGGSPYGFGGRSVLEVHNIPQVKTTLSGVKPNLSPTVVLNSNLVVRGNTYFPNEAGEMQVKDSGPVFLTRRAVNSYDKCRRPCFLGKKKWRVGKCNIWGILVSAIFGAILGAITGGAGAAALGVTIGSLVAGGSVIGGSIGAILGNNDAEKRGEDPFSYSFLLYEDKTCADSSTTYLSGPSCPDLRLSDENLKNILSENTDGLASIIKLMPYNYTFKDDKAGTKQVGVMAQDLQQIFPNDVSKNEKGNLQIRWDGIFFATINSVKELSAKTALEENKIATMENETKAIKNSHKNTQKRINELNKRIKRFEK